MCRARSTTNGCEAKAFSPEETVMTGILYPPAGGKGVHREVRRKASLLWENLPLSRDGYAKGSLRQRSVMTNRNRIPGLSVGVTEPWMRTPDSHSNGRGVNPA